MTAFAGDGQPGNISQADRLGGFVLKQIQAVDLDAAWIGRGTFQDFHSSYTMIETYGSDLTGFSAGGFVWASEATMNILAPAANIVGSYYRGTVQYGQLPPVG